MGSLIWQRLVLLTAHAPSRMLHVRRWHMTAPFSGTVQTGLRSAGHAQAYDAATGSLACMAKTENCPAAKGGTKAARLCAASKLIKMSAHLHQEHLRTPCRLSFCAATINRGENNTLAGHSGPDDVCHQDVSGSPGIHALQFLPMPCVTLRAQSKCSRAPLTADQMYCAFTRQACPLRKAAGHWPWWRLICPVLRRPPVFRKLPSGL